MVDTTRLLGRLRSYEKELQRHNSKVTAAFSTLERSLARLNAQYEGAAARDFKAHMARTQRGLDEYVKGTNSIRQLLNERIEALAAADRAGGLG